MKKILFILMFGFLLGQVNTRLPSLGTAGISSVDTWLTLQVLTTDTSRVVIGHKSKGDSTDSPKLSLFGYSPLGVQLASSQGIIRGPSFQKIATGPRGQGKLSVFQHDSTDWYNEVEVFAILADGTVLIKGFPALYDSLGVILNAPRTIYGWSHDLEFSATDNNTVAWTSGQLFFSNQDTFDIVAGSTGNMTDVNWIYWDEVQDPDSLWTTTEAGNSVV